MEPIRVPITDTLDLHTFRPAEVAPLLDDYLEACIEKAIFEVRIIHGKGSGRLRQRVQALLSNHPLVEGVRDAPPEGGGWGATLARLRRPRAAP
jgi:DNA-nicking Smr family endonuclease